MSTVFRSANPSAESGGFLVTTNCPRGRDILVQVAGSTTIQFWNEATNDWAATETLTAPGGKVACPSSKAKISGSAPVFASHYKINRRQ